MVASKKLGRSGEAESSCFGGKSVKLDTRVGFGGASTVDFDLRGQTRAMHFLANNTLMHHYWNPGGVLATNAITGATKRRYSVSRPGPDDRGALTELVLYAGEGVDAIRDIPSAGELVARLWKECLDLA